MSLAENDIVAGKIRFFVNVADYSIGGIVEPFVCGGGKIGGNGRNFEIFASE